MNLNLHVTCLFSIWTTRQMHDFQVYFPGLSLQEAWEPWHWYGIRPLLTHITQTNSTWGLNVDACTLGRDHTGTPDIKIYIHLQCILVFGVRKFSSLSRNFPRKLLNGWFRCSKNNEWNFRCYNFYQQQTWADPDGGTGGTCPLQTIGRHKWSDRVGFVSLAG